MAKVAAAPPDRHRALITFTEDEMDQLHIEAKQRGLKLSTYLRTLIVTHQERADGAGTR